MKQLKQAIQTNLGAVAYAAAEERRRKLLDELAATDNWMVGARKFAGLNEEKPVGQAIPRHAPPKQATVGTTHRRVIHGQEIVTETESLLRKVGKPLSRSEIVQGLRQSGIRVAGEDPKRNVAAVLWRRREHIANLKGHGYWPAALPCPAAGYEPARPAEETEPAMA